MNGLDIPTRDQQTPHADKTDVESDAKAAIYARTSSSSQRFGYSINEQVRRCWEQCQQAGWEVRYVFMDEAESGRNMDRPKFQSMLDNAKQGLIDVVVFWKLDRFCRSLADLVKTEERLNEWGVSLQSVTEYIDTTTPVGHFNFRNLASAAELETDLTSQRVKMGMYGLAQDHKWPNDFPPMGYDKASDGTLSVNEDEKNLVRRIFHTYLREKSMPQVAFLLNEEDFRTKNDEQWCRQSVKKILSNELYVGTYRIADYEDQVEEYRIISDELFESITEARYRFQDSKGRMDPSRKKTKSQRICSQYKNALKGYDENVG